MKTLALAAAILGIAVFLLGVLGRFLGAPEVEIVGQPFGAKSFVSVANTILLVAVLLRLLPADKR